MMKHKIILISLLIISLHASGQSHYIGFQGGLNLSNIAGIDVLAENPKYITGISGGLNYEFVFRNHFSVGADLFFNPNGYRNKSELIPGFDSLGTLETKSFINYLSLPVKLGFETGNRIKGFIKIGFNTSFLLNAKTIILGKGMNGISSKHTYNTTENAKKFDFGALIEIGTGIRLNEKLTFIAMTGYRHSFTNLSSSIDPLFMESLPKMKYYSINFSLGLKYKLN